MRQMGIGNWPPHLNSKSSVWCLKIDLTLPTGCVEWKACEARAVWRKAIPLAAWGALDCYSALWVIPAKSKVEIYWTRVKFHVASWQKEKGLHHRIQTALHTIWSFSIIVAPSLVSMPTLTALNKLCRTPIRNILKSVVRMRDLWFVIVSEQRHRKV